MKFKTAFLLMGAFLLNACDGGQAIFYWEKPDTGPVWFAKEHNECLKEADYWPWRWPTWPLDTERVPELRLDNDSDKGIWANFVPYDGAQPVYVNSLQNDGTMSPSTYKRCMLNKGYIERQPSVVRRPVVQ